MRVSLRGLGLIGLLFALCVAGCQGKKAKKEAASSATPVEAAQLRWEEVDTQGSLPIQLTGSDGQGLELVSVSARVIAQAPLAFTELHLRFHNPEPRVREGRFEITLPETAAISRFAMRVGDTYQEGEVVERRAAQEAYEDFLHRRQDPALLEQDAGNHFRARVFPIPASADKEIILSYSEELSDPKTPYRLHLAGLPTMQNLTVLVLGEEGELRVEEERFAPRGDLVLAGGQGAKPSIALRAGELFMARVTPKLDTRPADMKGLTVLFDTSASLALGYRARVERLTALIDGLKSQAGGDFPLEIVAFDQAAVSLYKGDASQLRGRGEAALLGRSPLGASNLNDALQTLAKGDVQPRLLIVTDAVITAGAEEDAELTRSLKQLGERGVRRADVLLVGGIHERSLAQRLTNVLGERGLVLDEQRSDNELRFALMHRPSSDLSIDVPGATWWWPRSVSSALPDESLLVMATLKSGTKQTAVRVGKETLEPASVLEVNEPLLRRAWARAKIRDLEDKLALLEPAAVSQRASMAAEIVAVSTRYRVLSGYTALLVLETDDDYRRFKITRTALSDILVVGERGLEVLSGKQRGVAVAAPTEKKGKIAANRMEGAAAQARPSGEAAQPEAQAASRGGANADAPARPAPAPTMRAADRDDIGGAPEEEAAPAPEPMAPARADSARERAASASVDDTNRMLERAGGGGQGSGRSLGGLSISAGGAGHAVGPGSQVAAPRPIDRAELERQQEWRERPKPDLSASLEGRLLTVLSAVEAHDAKGALYEAWRWRAEDPSSVLALIGLGAALTESGDHGEAARAYGSVIDLFASRADMRRMAGHYLERLQQPAALQLALDTYRRAREQRPDHPNSHRLYAWALVKVGNYQEALSVLHQGYSRAYPSGRFAGVEQILRDDARIVAKAFQAAHPEQTKDINETLSKLGVQPDATPSLRFVMSWETDANDVDFHIYDGKHGHAFFSRPTLPSGGKLFADVTTGYGPECFRIDRPKAYPYELSAHYYARGPMGYGMGKVQVMSHDGAGHLTFDERPFVVMKDRAFVHMGVIARP